MDVVTTSGPGTGEAAHVDKIRVMKEALDDFPLAIASGITPQNVGDYLPFSDCYMVATGISSSFVELDPRLVRNLVDTVRRYDSEGWR
jgi:predicted TIM-barrel enzyme